jgi:hypothetical protein
MSIRMGPTNKTVLNSSWNSNTDTYTTTTTDNVISAVHLQMRRCVLMPDGTVNYYLDPDDSTKKIDGTPSVLTGADGNVMVEIPKFSFSRTLAAGNTTWEIVFGTREGYTLHPAFFKAGVEVSHRYVSAYDACYLDATDSLYKSGTNLDDATSTLDLSNDKLSSVSGIHPLVGATRNECSMLAANNGSGWVQLDFNLWSAIQILYIVEYANFNSQATLGSGNTDGSYVASSSSQADSPHIIAGATNNLGNNSTDLATGTGFVSYRGIENLYGNCSTWTNGINVNIGTAGTVYVASDYRNFADDTLINYDLITSAFETTDGFIRNLLQTGAYFLSSINLTATSITYVTDYHFASTSLLQIVCVGGDASAAGGAGILGISSNKLSSSADRKIGCRLCF